MFGFSRGAYTARSLAGMVGRVGLLTRDALVADKLPEAVARYQRRGPADGSFGESDAGVPPRPLPPRRHGPAARGLRHRRRARRARGWSVGSTSSTTSTSGRSCCAPARRWPTDERRLKFEPCLWEADEATRAADEASGRVQQVWFEGVHSDVGGGYAETGLCDTTLLWMVVEANRRGLVFDTRLLATYVGSGSAAVRHDSLNRCSTGC